jgi:hypothetical protein
MPNVTSYGPVMMEFWRRAAGEQFDVILPNKKTGTAMRHRLYQLRKDMQKEKHSLFPLIDKLVLRVINLEPHAEGGKWILRVSAQDVRYEELLEASGVHVEKPDLEVGGKGP